VLDGSERVDAIIRRAMPWDVLGGVARRAWARNPNALETIAAHNRNVAGLNHVTLPYLVDDDLIAAAIDHTSAAS
jgi:urocanate hydratase